MILAINWNEAMTNLQIADNQYTLIRLYLILFIKKSGQKPGRF